MTKFLTFRIYYYNCAAIPKFPLKLKGVLTSSVHNEHYEKMRENKNYIYSDHYVLPPIPLCYIAQTKNKITFMFICGGWQ